MKYKIVLFNSFGEDKEIFYNTWLYAKAKMIWLTFIGKRAIWMEKVK